MLASRRAPPLSELAKLGVARVSWDPLLHREAMERFGESVAALATAAREGGEAYGG